jgi:hypothetical protein
MTDLTPKEMIATILRSLEKTGRRFAADTKSKAAAARQTEAGRRKSKSRSSRPAARKGGKKKS